MSQPWVDLAAMLDRPAPTTRVLTAQFFNGLIEAAGVANRHMLTSTGEQRYLLVVDPKRPRPGRGDDEDLERLDELAEQIGDAITYPEPDRCQIARNAAELAKRTAARWTDASN